MKIAVIGAGSWGTAIAILLAKKNYSVYLWAYQKEKSDLLNQDRENKEYLSGSMFPDNIICLNDMGLCIQNADLVVFVSPSTATRSIANQAYPFIKDGQPILNMSKGLEEGSLLRLSQVYKEVIPQSHVAVMSGPSHAEEVSKCLPTTNVVASEHDELSKYIQDIFMSDTFRVYTSDDVIGVEMGGALKNVIALCAGISDGLGFGDNTRAALMTRGITEIARLGTVMGAKSETFAGLSGIGDLIVTCTSEHSRNRRAGILLGQGYSLAETLKKVHMVVEGVNTARSAYELSKRYDVCMPIVDEAYHILFDGKNPRDAVVDLMTRNKTQE